MTRPSLTISTHRLPNRATAAAIRRFVVSPRRRRRRIDGTVALHEAAQSRYLNYALSVITARALPDVRDGLKPVQRRILYTMWQQNLTADAKHRKCAKVVGDVMGSFHPHGDVGALRDAGAHGAAVLAALSAGRRLGQLRIARRRQRRGDALHRVPAGAASATRCSTEIEQTTVPFRPNYDGTKTEPVVLPARIPNLLVNGATGIAVGMATNIPPHNLGEVCTALIKLLDNEEIEHRAVVPLHQGPRLPHRRPDPELAGGAEGDLQDRVGIDPAARHVGHRPGNAIDQDDLHRQHPVHGQQGAAGRADRRGRARAASCRSCST